MVKSSQIILKGNECMRKTKIVCTLGPATDNEEVLRNLMLEGMNVARINFSHGNYQDQADRINMFKKVREELKLPVPLLLDTQGPEIRIGKFENDKVYLENGQEFTLTNNDELGNKEKVSITYKTLYQEIDIGRTILVNDGTIELKVKEIKDTDIVCVVIQGGKLTNRKSINIPDFCVNLPGITEKDIGDIKYGIQAGFDYIAASFVRKPQDVLEIRKVLKENGGEHIKIISKIENREGIDNFDEILNVSDGIMVARGDLGVEIPMEEVPIYQKQFIKKTYKQGKPVITATQMLESMITNPKPTRAEVSDVANAIYDGSSSIMLSGETASGSFPVECVKTMNRIATKIESSIKYWKRYKNRDYDLCNSNCEFIMNYAVCTTAMNVEAKAIIAYTNTGNTARMVSSFGPGCPIFAITQNERIYRQLGLCWGITPKLFEPQPNIDVLLHKGLDKLIEEGFLVKGDKVVIAGGTKVLTDIPNEELQKNNVMGGVVEI